MRIFSILFRRNLEKRLEELETFGEKKTTNKGKPFTLRQNQLNEKILRRLQTILTSQFAHHPVIQPTNIDFQNVTLTQDLSTAKVTWDSLPTSTASQEQIEEVLNSLEGTLRHLLTRSIQVKYIPKLVFLKQKNPLNELDAVFTRLDREDELRKKLNVQVEEKKVD